MYLLPGLGADVRIFNRILPGDGFELIALPWIPAGSAANLRDYAALLHAHYQPEPPYVLGGVSLGGMLAQEWARIAPPQALVLISTAVSRSDMAVFIRAASALGVGPVLNKPLLVTLAGLGDRFVSKSAEGRALFQQMLHLCDEDFMAWAAAAVLDWQPPGIEVPYLRIHGDNDKVFPLHTSKPWVTDTHGKGNVIAGGNHFMVYERGDEVAACIARYFDLPCAQ